MKRFVAFMASVLAALGICLAVSPVANAVTCYGDYCSNKDPQATGCSAGSWTQESVDVYYQGTWNMHDRYAGHLELRGSTKCGSTQWGRFSSQAPVTYYMRAEQPETGYTTSWRHGGFWQQTWTNQIYSPKKCVRIHIYTIGAFNNRREFYTPCI